MSTPEEWALAYAKQAKADLDAHDFLCQRSLDRAGRGAALPICQSHHFLQMACEKLCKAYLCRAGSDPKDLQGSHAYIAKPLPVALREQFARGYGRPLRDKSWLMQHIRHFAREIELLSPAVDDGGRRPDNCEYPWEDATSEMRIPADHEFPNLSFLKEPSGTHFLKLVRWAIEDQSASRAGGS
jgi:hypothetical protein